MCGWQLATFESRKRATQRASFATERFRTNVFYHCGGSRYWHRFRNEDLISMTRSDAKDASRDALTDSGVTTSDALSSADQLLSLYDSLHQRQLREAAAEIAAAIAHAMGTPLNVISGRAELIRQDPAKAAIQATKIEEQVRNMANGLRQLVDYLAPPESTASGVPARPVFADALGLLAPLAQRHGVQLSSDSAALEGALVPRWHLLTNLVTLAALAIRCAARAPVEEQRRLLIGARVDGGNVVIELDTPGLEVLEGWQLDKFQARPLPAAAGDEYRLLSVCATIARGNGGRLALEPITGGARIRLLCRTAPASP
jgi:signal transduction histidine kinase